MIMKKLKITLSLLFISILIFSCEKNEDDPPLPSITEWANIYNTETQWWGAYYSPLVITADGKLFIAEHEIEFEFDVSENRLTFDWHDIKEYRAKGNIVFSKKVDGRMEFSGSINPRAQDGPVGYTGRAY
jgi:hypothetical protein